MSGHEAVGIALTDVGHLGPQDNVVRANMAESNRADLALFLVMVPSSAAAGNCFEGNAAAATMPVDLQPALGCEGSARLPAALPPPLFPSAPTGVDPISVPAPRPQPSMPDAATAPAAPAGGPAPIDVAALPVPAAPS